MSSSKRVHVGEAVSPMSMLGLATAHVALYWVIAFVLVLCG